MHALQPERPGLQRVCNRNKSLGCTGHLGHPTGWLVIVYLFVYID